ncbi:MAG: hypothetical protein O3C10_04530 [Chloroflexi bacterium]|nr:hypothetical protein [Chloroflexota bacterium]
MAVQTFHMVEHVAQTLQKFVLGSTSPHGLVGQLDLEWVHFAFNTVYLVLFVVIVALWLKVGHRFTTMAGSVAIFLIFGLLFQGWHQVEHSVKFIQFIDTGMQGTPGVAGRWVDGVVLHFLYNAAVYAPIAFVFFMCEFYKESLNLLPGRKVQGISVGAA